MSDSGVINQAWQQYVAENGISGSAGCEKATEDRGYGLLGRIAPEIGDVAEPAAPPAEPRGAHRAGDARLQPGGQQPVRRRADPVPAARTAPPRCSRGILQPRAGAPGHRSAPRRARSDTMGVCVEGADTTYACDRHVVTTVSNGRSSDPGQPADYQAAILAWVRARLADD